MVMKLGILH